MLPLVGVGAVTAADSLWTQTSRADFESGALSQLDASGNPGSVKLATAGVNYLYAFRGNNQKTFWRYNIVTNVWTSLADAPDKVKWGGALAYDGGNYIYAFRGYGSTDFWRYSISANTWMVIAAAPAAVREGGALTYNNGFIYALRGNGTRDFWMYNPSANTWSARTDTGSNVCFGGALTGDGGNHIYAFYGHETMTFARYDITANIWTAMADAPAAVKAGGSLTYDDNRYIYALCGGMTPYFWQYDTFNDTWSSKSYLPASADWGGALVFVPGGSIFALPGACSQHFWRYTVDGDAWEWCTGTPAVVWDGGALVRGKAKYYSSGTIISSSYNTGTNADFGTISWTAVTPPGTSVKFQIAANTDNATWLFKGPDGTAGTYYTSGAAVWSGLDGSRYVKYKALLGTSDTGVTPVLHDVTLTYSRKITLPAVTIDEASSVSETSAVLSGAVVDDGGEFCQYRFQYGTVAGNYTRETAWTGSVMTGETFNVEITGLGKGAKYYYRAQLKNSVGISGSPENSLLTRPAPPVSGSFIAKAVNTTHIYVSWIKGEGAKRTMVRRKIGGYPVDINDGTQVYFDTGSSFTDTGLDPDTAYYYRAWSEVTGSQQWSSGSQSASATTTLPVAVGGVVFKVNKVVVLAPWLAAVVLLLTGSVIVARRIFRVKA
jgi:hypothetical protein